MKKLQEPQNFTKYLGYAGTPFLLVVAPCFGYFIGFWLDNYFQTTPYLSYFFLSLGVVAGIREFYKLVKEIGKDDHPSS
jgi:ATP synthase protein I